MSPKIKSALGRKLRQGTLGAFLGGNTSSSPEQPKPHVFSNQNQKIQRARVQPRKKQAILVSSEENDDSDDSDDVAAVAFEPSESDEDGGDSGSPKKPTRNQSRLLKLGSWSNRGLESEGAESDDNVPPTTATKRSIAEVVNLSSGDEEVVRPRKIRKLVKGVRPSFSSDEKEEGLLDEVDSEKIVEERLRSRSNKDSKRKKYLKGLEKLKRRRGVGTHLQSPESSVEDGDNDRGGDIIPGAKPGELGISDQSDDDEEEEEDSFIVDDGPSTSVALPLRFSMAKHQDLAHHFKIICQLFVHLAVRPPDDRRAFMTEILEDDEHYFNVSLNQIRRKLDGMRDSMVASSVWRRDFKESLSRCSEIQLTSMEMAVQGCDACHLGARISTIEARISGQRYDRVTFESLDESDSSEDSESDDDCTVYHTVFHLGRFCASRTRVFHDFMHWEYHLYEALSNRIASAQAGDRFVRVANEDSIQPPADPMDADGWMNWLDSQGAITVEWEHGLKDMMKRAESLEMSAGRGGGGDKYD